ncbi:endoribonuclease L-PSP [Sporobacter termitidis DSM 10068]|uniref:Endoribonuclease L-PSP n=1 Tax=Sporobacter termitidis DSM 10068 TaxID=1123282 RepID=A0A1M5ZCA6_9FIRM|nr:RidA family protein [Sporobacter termitidis]SHI21563.1 endoribonuclease L-PSP [Sporobacter termitidis DSM 10068]
MDIFEIRTEKSPAAVGPYSQAVRAGDFIYASGQIPLDPASGAVVPGDVAAQAAQALKNLEAVLEAAGTGLDRVVKTTVFIRDMNAFARVNEVYAGFFKAPFPARSCVEVSRLPKDVLVEIEAVAVAR